MQAFIFSPARIYQYKEWYRFISAGFVHADWMHLLVNMFVLYSFGSFVESAYRNLFAGLSTLYFLVLYLGALVVSLLPTYKKNKLNTYYHALGASGAVSAIVFASILFAPWQMLYLFGIIPLPSVLFGLAYLIYTRKMTKQNNDGINHEAHFWGAIFGILYTVLLKPSLLLFFFQQLINVRF